jgi:nucleoside-diphosphate-sugar epimerase
MVQRLSSRSMPLVDGGRYPSNLIHVDNLVEAILTVARADSGSGERYFVNEAEPISWKTVFDDFAGRLDFQMTYVDVPRDRVVPHLFPESAGSSSGLAAHMRVLLSADFRRAASMLPAFDWANQTAYNLFKRLPPSRQDRIRERLRGPVRIQKPRSDVRLDERYVTVQARRYYHSTARLQGLGWRPPLNYMQGVESMVSWLRFAGIGCEAERLGPRVA